MGGILVRLTTLALLTVGILVFAGESNARLRPYYVVRNATGELELRPRVLFVLDTSGSMSLRAQSESVQCDWSDCESDEAAGTNRESRMAAARRAINNVVEATGDDASFALMTFEQNDPWEGVLPSLCPGAADGDGGVEAGPRFEYVNQAIYPWLAWADIYRVVGGELGSLRLCQGTTNRPYPYIRWDQLGIDAVVTANNEVGDVPASPLIPDGSLTTNWENYYRPVQWFDRFVGVRFQPNATSDPDHLITYGTVGDYGMDETTQDAEVWGNDFYYWPYVDGFPGYGNIVVFPYYDDQAINAGVALDDTAVNEGKLYAPFYIDFPEDTVVLTDDQGPASEEEARTAVLAQVSPLIMGGVDSAGVTPWRDTVGVAPVDPLMDNSLYSHGSIAGYLSFVIEAAGEDSECVPTTAVLITDGEPWPEEQGGADLYARLSDLRRDMGVDTYVVGFFLDGSAELSNMACAAAGACDGASCDTPCDDDPVNDWDTCANGAAECAYVATSADELQAALTQIVATAVDVEVPSGPSATVNEFGLGEDGNPGEGDILQTSFSARTDYPSWQGHLSREACTDVDGDGNPQPYCTVADPQFQPEDVEETFGVPECPQSRVWDAGVCLQETAAADRRIYSHNDQNELVEVADTEGVVTAGFVQLLTDEELIDLDDPEGHGQTVVDYLLGVNAPDNWKLPGLANSAPIVVRRIPPYRSEFLPPIALRDPHCGGRFIGAAGSVPDSLVDYARDVWDADALIASPSPHYEQQEAVVIGDDMGVIHAFQLDSGNELWGLVPRFALASVVEQAAIGPATYGQDGEIEDHNYGVAATLNHGWVYDDTAADEADHRWRHMGYIGMGNGGQELIALDLSHMSPESPDGPVEILWTTEDTTLDADYDQMLGETWARPAIGYHVDSEIATNEPDAFLVMGSGYPMANEDGSDPDPVQGRTLLRIDALDGTIIESAEMDEVDYPVFEDLFGAVVDPSIGTHCLSRYWAEAQETYIADPAGRLYRWDLGRETAHESDSGGEWGGTARLLTTSPFTACVASADGCTVSDGNPADPFLFPPAISANDRIDDFLSGTANALVPTDQFLIALISGSAADDSLTTEAGLHSSLYVMVDDHSGPDKDGGLSVPDGAPLAAPGTDPAYMRVPITDIARTRYFRPYPAEDVLEDPGTFSDSTRPIRAPRIFVTGAVDEDSVGEGLSPVLLDGVEVYYIQFIVYEPPANECDPRWYDASTGTWYQDPGQSYEITFRVTNTSGTPFDFENGAGEDEGGGGGGGGENPYDFGEDFGGEGLTLVEVEQLGGTDCQGGECGTNVSTPAATPCDNNDEPVTSSTNAFSLTVYQSELAGFTPIE